MVLFIVFYKVVLAFESGNEVLKHLTRKLLTSAMYCAVQGASKS